MSDREDAIEVNGSTLRVCGELGPDRESEFGEATRRLLASADDPLVIDLTDVQYMSSCFVRHVVAIALEARRLRRRVRLVAGRRVIRILEFGRLDTFENVELAQQE